MRVLLLFCHPVEDSYHAALHRTARGARERAGPPVDDCDLYAEGFCPVLSRAERIGYHDTARNRLPVQIRPAARVIYLAHYHMNVSTEATRRRFLAQVERAMARF